MMQVVHLTPHGGITRLSYRQARVLSQEQLNTFIRTYMALTAALLPAALADPCSPEANRIEVRDSRKAVVIVHLLRGHYHLLRGLLHWQLHPDSFCDLWAEA